MDEALLKRMRRDANKEIKASLRQFCEIPISSQIIDYQLGLLKGMSEAHRGKLFRPLLCLLSCRSLSRDYKKALPAAAAIELIHNFSLVHDDIQDEDEYRRGRKTVWKIWGKSQAINAGDAMQAMANIALNRLYKAGVSPRTAGAVSLAINHACFRMCEGQMVDIALESRLRASLPEYFDMIRNKTAALIESASCCGAMLATHRKNTIESFRRFGYYTGMAFQVFNDLSGFWGGKKGLTHLQSDLIKKKKALPLVLAMENAKGITKKKIMKIVGKPSPDRKDAGILVSLIKESGAADRVYLIGSSFLKRAIFELHNSGIENRVANLLEDFVWKIAS